MLLVGEGSSEIRGVRTRLCTHSFLHHLEAGFFELLEDVMLFGEELARDNEFATFGEQVFDVVAKWSKFAADHVAKNLVELRTIFKRV